MHCALVYILFGPQTLSSDRLCRSEGFGIQKTFTIQWYVHRLTSCKSVTTLYIRNNYIVHQNRKHISDKVKIYRLCNEVQYIKSLVR